MESIHIFGKADPWFDMMVDHRYYSKDPIVVIHSEGHKIPKSYPPEDFEVIKNFVKRQYKAKNNGSEEGFSVD